MMANAIDREMFAYFMQLSDAEKKSVVELLKTFIKERVSQFEPASIEQYNKEIDDAMKRVRDGEYTTFEELEKEIGTW